MRVWISRRTVALLFGVSLLSVGGCGAASINSMTCDDVEAEVVALSQTPGTGPSLIKILNGTLVSQTDDKIVCRGDGIYDDRSQMETRYQAYLDQEGEVMIEYDTDEYIEREVQASAREFEAEVAQVQQQAEQEAAAIQRQIEAGF